MNQNVVLIVTIFILFFIYCQLYGGNEQFEGTSWFPRDYMMNINRELQGQTDTGDLNAKTAWTADDLETPEFQRFDNGNNFKGPFEVGSMNTSVNNIDEYDRLYPIDTSTQRFLNQKQLFMERGGNSGNINNFTTNTTMIT